VPSGALPLSIVVAVAAIAYWVVVRFPTLAPRTALGVTGWVGAAVGLTFAARPVFVLIGSITGSVAALVIVEVVSGVCMMLAVAWTTLWVIRATATSHRA
jgi:hypothetical protein